MKADVNDSPEFLKVLCGITYDINEKLKSEEKKISVITTNNIKYKPTNEFVILFAEALLETIEQYKLKLSDIKTILQIINYAKYGNLISMSRRGLAHDLGTNYTSICKSLKNLLACGIIIETENGNLYLNPQVIAKGKLREFSENEKLKNQVEQGAEILMKKLNRAPNIKTKDMIENEQTEKIENERKRKIQKKQIVNDQLWFMGKELGEGF